MKNHILLTLVVLLCAFQNIRAQMIYQILDEKIVMEETVSVEDNTAIPQVFAHFINQQGGCLPGSFLSRGRSYCADIVSPVLHVSKFSAQSTAVIHFVCHIEQRLVKLRLTSDMVNVYFSNTQLTHRYNPAINYPVIPLHDQNETYIDKEDVDATFKALIKTMRGLKRELSSQMKQSGQDEFL